MKMKTQKRLYTSFYFLIVLIAISVLSSFMLHPYHVGSVEMNYNARSKTFEVSGRFFMDDLENALSKYENKNIRFLSKKDEKTTTEAVKKYSLNALKIKVNGKEVPVHFLGYQEDKESIEIFLESSTIPVPKKVETSVKFIYNLYNDQMNIVHIIVNGKRKSERLNYPKSYLAQEF